MKIRGEDLRSESIGMKVRIDDAEKVLTGLCRYHKAAGNNRMATFSDGTKRLITPFTTLYLLGDDVIHRQILGLTDFENALILQSRRDAAGGHCRYKVEMFGERGIVSHIERISGNEILITLLGGIRGIVPIYIKIKRDNCARRVWSED